jgi:hypothetical protein
MPKLISDKHYSVTVQLPFNPQRRQQLLDALTELRNKFGRKVIGSPVQSLYSRNRELDNLARRERRQRAAPGAWGML